MIKKSSKQNHISILNFVKDDPGINMSQLAKKLGWTSGRLYYHLNILENTNIIRTDHEIVNGRLNKQIFIIERKYIQKENH